jgi:hypothetical protein
MNRYSDINRSIDCGEYNSQWGCAVRKAYDFVLLKKIRGTADNCFVFSRGRSLFSF